VGPRSAPEDPRLTPHLASELSPKVCWQYYQNILQQQEDVIIPNKDAEALWYGLERFPALKRITLTPAAHGWLWAPVYETPMIRAFPKGFNYPIPRGWTNGRNVWSGAPAKPWEDPGVRETYRGFGIITRALTEYPEHQISELVIDVNYLETGLNCRVFEEPSAEYHDFGTILQGPEISTPRPRPLCSGRGAHRVAVLPQPTAVPRPCQRARPGTLLVSTPTSRQTQQLILPITAAVTRMQDGSRCEQLCPSKAGPRFVTLASRVSTLTRMILSTC
jgi:hypothetical protein